MAHEIRLRNVPPQLMKQAEQLQAFFKEATITGAFEKVIPWFFTDQQTIKDLRQDNEELERKNDALEAREADAKNLLYQFHSMLQSIGVSIKRYDKSTLELIPKFSKRKKAKGQKKKSSKTRARRSARPGKKMSHKPGKKGGKK